MFPCIPTSSSRTKSSFAPAWFNHFGMQLVRHDLVEQRFLGTARRKISNIAKRVNKKVWSLRDRLVALVATLLTIECGLER